MSEALTDALYSLLWRDEEFAEQFGLDLSSTSEEIDARIVQGMEPDKAITSEDVPLVCFYTKPGRYGRNHLVFEGKFCLDFYGKNSTQAKHIAERAFKLLHDKYIVAEGFHSYRCTLAYDSDFSTGISGVKGYKAIYDVDYLRK